MHWATWALQQGIVQPTQLRPTHQGDTTHLVHVLQQFLELIPVPGHGIASDIFLGCEQDLRHLAGRIIDLLSEVRYCQIPASLLTCPTVQRMDMQCP